MSGARDDLMDEILAEVERQLELARSERAVAEKELHELREDTDD